MLFSKPEIRNTPAQFFDIFGRHALLYIILFAHCRIKEFNTARQKTVNHFANWELMYVKIVIMFSTKLTSIYVGSE